MLVLGVLVLIPALLYCKVSLQSAGCVAELCRVFHNIHLQCSLSVRMLPYKQSADSEAAHWVWDQSDCVYRCLVSPMEQYNPPVLFSLHLSGWQDSLMKAEQLSDQPDRWKCLSHYI